ncbi:MAG: GIY-YIG nuclease family protein [Anaerolineales bacterium]
MGVVPLKPGAYLYVGSALGSGGVRARVARHSRDSSNKHWHIDYLRPSLTLKRVFLTYCEQRLEHDWATAMMALSGAENPIPGFGSSDCRCAAHLFFFEITPNIDELAWRLADKSAGSTIVEHLAVH